jgi:CheY-like chemotaxis protein
MDITMPQMDGIQCTKEIRKLADPKKNSIPIIAITGNAANHTPEDFRKFGFNDFIQKPLNYDHLLATVKKILG